MKTFLPNLPSRKTAGSILLSLLVAAITRTSCRALTNLAENAVAYGARVRISILSENYNLVVRVDDDGPGIPEEELARVFEPFYRLERSRSRETGGTGIGLCIVQSIAQAHGGEIRLANRAEGGLRAELVLPR